MVSKGSQSVKDDCYFSMVFVVSRCWLMVLDAIWWFSILTPSAKVFTQVFNPIRKLSDVLQKIYHHCIRGIEMTHIWRRNRGALVPSGTWLDKDPIKRFSRLRLNKKSYISEIGHKWKLFQIPLRLKFSNAWNWFDYETFKGKVLPNWLSSSIAGMKKIAQK